MARNSGCFSTYVKGCIHQTLNRHALLFSLLKYQVTVSLYYIDVSDITCLFSLSLTRIGDTVYCIIQYYLPPSKYCFSLVS